MICLPHHPVLFQQHNPHRYRLCSRLSRLGASPSMQRSKNKGGNNYGQKKYFFPAQPLSRCIPYTFSSRILVCIYHQLGGLVLRDKTGRIACGNLFIFKSGCRSVAGISVAEIWDKTVFVEHCVPVLLLIRFILPVFSSQRNLRSGFGWTVFWIELVVLIIIPVIFLVISFAVNRMNRNSDD